MERFLSSLERFCRGRDMKTNNEVNVNKKGAKVIDDIKQIQQEIVYF